jgi:hypothetical protein
VWWTTINFVRDADGAWLQHQGVDLRVEDRTRAPSVRARDAGGDGTVRAAMTDESSQWPSASATGSTPGLRWSRWRR